MNTKTWTVIAALAALTNSVLAQEKPAAGEPTYKTGYNSLLSIGKDLYKGLKPALRDTLNPQPVLYQTDTTPYVRAESVKYEDEPNPINGVFISIGFVDLLNNLAHAKAIDETIEKGFLEKYLAQTLSKETGANELKELPKLADKKYWAEEVLDAQRSYFDQIGANIIAIEMSHFYLGHHKKYKDKLMDSSGRQTIPINTLLLDKEWEESVVAGVKNAMECGYLTAGIIHFYDAMGKMKERPPWTIHFITAKAKPDRIKKDIKKMENKFLGL